MRYSPRASERGSDYSRRIFVRYATATEKTLVQKMAKMSGCSMSQYLRAASLDWAKRGLKVETAAGPTPVAKAA